MASPHIDHAARAEDLAFMAATGETVEGAARRLGITRTALEHWCDNHDLRHLYRDLARNAQRSRV